MQIHCDQIESPQLTSGRFHKVNQRMLPFSSLSHADAQNRPKFRATKVLKLTFFLFFLKDKKLLENILTDELHIKRLKTITITLIINMHD